MDFFKLLQSFDDLLYEVMSWLIFYPVTLWRAIRHPRQMIDYADTELADAPDEQYTDTLSPPLFLLLSLILSHGIELAMVGQNAIVKSNRGLDAVINSDTNLILLRVFLFSLFPLLMAARLVRRQGTALTRETLKPPFYSQCYVVAPFALVIGLAGDIATIHLAWAVPAALAIAGLALIWYGSLQIGWFARHLGTSLWRGTLDASIGMVECLAATIVVMMLFA